MSELASLLPGIAAVITSIGGVVVSLYAINRGSKRERQRTAKTVIDRVLGADDEDDQDDRSEAIAEILEELRKHQEGDDA